MTSTMEGKTILTYYEKQKAKKKDLQRQLVNLTRVHRLLLHARNKAAGTTAVPARPKMSVWEGIASQGLTDLQASEERHRFLLSAVCGKNELIRDLITLVRQHMRTLRAITAQIPNLYADVFLQPSDELVYGMYSHELSDVYRQTDQVLKDCGLGFTEESTAFQRVTTTEQGVSIVEICQQKVFPFGYRQTCDSIWMMSSMIHQQEEREEYDNVDDPKNTMAIKVRYTRRLEGGGSESLVHLFVNKRFVEGDREVIVRKSSMRGDGSFRGLHVEGTGWGVFRRSANGSGTFGQTCARQTLLHLNSPNEMLGALARQFDEFVQSMVHDNYQETTRMAESLLLDDALNNIKM